VEGIRACITLPDGNNNPMPFHQNGGHSKLSGALEEMSSNGNSSLRRRESRRSAENRRLDAHIKAINKKRKSL